MALPKTQPPSEHVERLCLQLQGLHAPPYEREFPVLIGRNFRIDIFFPKARLAVEIDGGGWINGRHSRGYGLDSDAEKSALIAAMPARLIRVTPKWIKNGKAVDWILKALNTGN